jgi:hypothetical protein
MNPRLSLLATAIGSLLVSGAIAHAQSTNEPGLIGKQYFGADYTYDHFNGNTVDHAHGAGGIVNIPASRIIDLTLAYNYYDGSGPGYDQVDKVLAGSVLTHQKTEYGTAYFAGTLGHSWHRLDIRNVGVRDNGAFWGVRAGYEIPMGRSTAINAGLGYSRAFDSNLNRNETLRYYAEANHWFSPVVAGVVSASYKQIKNAPDAVGFTAGLRWNF